MINVGILLFDEVEVLDFAGPFEVFSTASRLALRQQSNLTAPFSVFTISQTERVKARGGLFVSPQFRFDHHPLLEVLIVPGGDVAAEMNKPDVIAWIAVQSKTSRLVASICTGAFLLGKAGLLDGKRATTHWEDISDLRRLLPNTDVLENERWVDEGSVITSAGISAGIDMSLHLVSRLAGLDLAVRTARQMEYDDSGFHQTDSHSKFEQLADPQNRKSATYTPGHSESATEFMARRTIESHGEFFLPYLTPGVSVLDCGCGPGSITLGIANRIGAGRVIGVDFGESQIQRANETAKDRGIRNAVFQQADCYSLPFEDASFDRIFSNALMEHLTDPVRAMRELLRVLKPGGVIGVSSPDWAGFVLAPPSDPLIAAVAAYTTMQTRNGGDVNVGRKLGTHLESAGFLNGKMSARYEVYPSLPLIGEYLAVQLERAGDSASAATFRSWSRESGGLFAQCWVSCVAQAPLDSC